MLPLLSCESPGSANLKDTSSSIPTTERTLFAVYMVGSNLEDDVKPRNGIADEIDTGAISKRGSASNDIREIIEAYQTLSKPEQAQLDVVLAFGSARKEGWKGMKYADIDCLIKDNDDDYFGNSDCYQHKDDNANMAEEKSFTEFLNFLKTNYSDHGRKVLNFWNHGLSYLGAGYNTQIEGKKDYVTLPEMKTSFETTGFKADILGFDACLMASMEVARTVKPFAKYLVGSEELEPGHGWDYTEVLPILTQTNSLPDIGKKLVDSYIDSPDHKASKHSKFRTLSVLDLSKVDHSVESFNQLVAQLNVDEFDVLLNALKNSQRFGEAPRGDIEYSIDLMDWVTQLKIQKPELGSSAEHTLNALKEMVIYARHDGTKPNANGVSIYSLNTGMKKNYGQEQSVSEPWLNFANTFINKGTNDTDKPSLSGNNFITQQVTPDNICTYRDKQGHCLEINDNLGLKAVEQVYSLKADQRFYFMIGSEKLEPVDKKGNYFAPVWNGEWFLLCDGGCDSGLSLFPPAYFSGQTESGTRLYTSEAELNGQAVIFYLEVGKNNGVVDHWMIPYEIGDHGEPIISREQLSINVGDQLAFYFQVFDAQEEKKLWKKGEALTFTTEPQWQFANIEADRAYLVQAEDFQGNIKASELYEVKTTEMIR